MSEHRKLKISFNSPVILSFAILCFLAVILNFITRGFANQVFFSVYRSSLLNPLAYVRFSDMCWDMRDGVIFLEILR